MEGLIRRSWIDVPVDEWAKVVLPLAALCNARDEAKQQALQRSGIPAQF
jgi:hypothetical protein